MGALADDRLRQAEGGVVKKPRKNPRGRFVMLYADLIESAAWVSLSGNERALYVHIASRYNGKNNGQIPFSAREAVLALHISRATTARALRNLIDRGFITVAKRSGFNLKRGPGRATEYRLTEYPCNVTGEPASCKFKNWRRGKNGSENISRSHQGSRSVSPENPISLTREPEADSDPD
jgi:hypothetical protein